MTPLFGSLQRELNVVAVCHAPGVLRHAKAPDGSPLVRDKSVTGFANSEEEQREDAE
jgi:putative intracellular protease/amidase